MKSKIFNVAVFALAIIGSLFSLWFAAMFNDSSDIKEFYYSVNIIKDENPQIIMEAKALTPEQLPAFLAKYSKEEATFNEHLKDEKLQRDILYTFIDQLKNIDTEKDLVNYKTNFDAGSRNLLSRSKIASQWITGFKNVQSMETLNNFIVFLEGNYVTVKQEYLAKKDYSIALGTFLKKAAEVNNVVSQIKKEADFNTFITHLNQSLRESNRLNISMILVYIIFFIAIIITLFFAIIQIIRSIKTSYKALLAVLSLILIFVVSYFLSSGELIPSAMSMNHTIPQVKAIEAGLVLCYILLFTTVLAMIWIAIYNKLKKV